jgi:hypothetical protein
VAFVAPVLIALVLDGGEWSVSRFGCFIAGRNKEGGWAPQPVWTLEKRRIFYPSGESNPDSSFIQLIV